MTNYCDCCGNSSSGSTSGSIGGSASTGPKVLNGTIYAPEYVDAYDIAVQNGFKGTAKEWLDSLHGADGKSAYEDAVAAGFKGTEEEWLDSLKGSDGLSAYQVAKRAGFEGSRAEWLESLKGEDGVPGPEGPRGKSAYQVAKSEGFEGTREEWLESLKGQDGKSQWEIAVEHGYPEDKYEEWLESLNVILNHQQLEGRNERDCHPISSITNLKPSLEGLHAGLDELSYEMGDKLDIDNLGTISMSYQDVLDICKL